MSFANGLPEERLFEAALALDPSEREAFILQAAGDNQALLDSVRELLEGYAEHGGDEAPVTLTDGPGSARQRWAVATEEPGTVIDHFRLVRCLGEGGMGTVWEAEQTEPVSRKVALKVIKLGMDTREVVQRFQRERQTLALMQHPHIAQVYEAGATVLGRPYFAMEFVPGIPITQHCQKAGLTLHEKLALFLEVCDAIEHAHQKGIIHRDLKPSNILISEGHVKVIDFGVSKVMQGIDEPGTLLTKVTQLLGTPAYMSPEQAISDGQDIDTRSDVYSLGVVLYEILSGQLPFDPKRLSETSIAEVQKILTGEVPPRPSRHPAAPESLDGTLLRELDWVTMKALAKERERRYPSAAALAEDLRRFLANEPVSAVSPTWTYVFGKFVRKHRLAVASLTAIFLALAAGLGVSLLQTQRANQARQEVTFTVADLYTRKGLDEPEPTTAALWFAQAAVVAEADPIRLETNRYRTAAWRQEARTAVRALSTGMDYTDEISWNPRHPSIITSSSYNKEAQVWEVTRSQRWSPLKERKIQQAIWGPDGDYLAIVDGNVVSVVSYPAGETLSQIEITTGPPTWSPDGRWIAITSPVPLLWDWRSDQRVALPPIGEESDGTSWAMAFSPDGELLLATQGGHLGICRVAEPLAFLYPPRPASLWITPSFLPDGRSFYAADRDHTLFIADAQTGKITKRFPEVKGSEPLRLALVSSPDSKLVSVVGEPLLDSASGEFLDYPERGSNVEGRAFSPDGSLFASGGYDNTLSLWSVASGQRIDTIGHGNYSVLDTSFSPDGRWLASSEQGLVRVWRLDLPRLGRALPIDSNTLAKLSPDGKTLTPSGYSHLHGEIRSTQAYEITTTEIAGPKLDIDGLLMDVAYGSDGSWLACAVSTTPDRQNTPFTKESGEGGSGHILRFDPQTGTRLGPPIPMPSEPRGVCVHPSGLILGVCCAAGEGMEINLETGEVKQLFDNAEISHPHEFANNGRCAYSPDGRVFVVWGLYMHLHLWDRAAGEHLRDPVFKAFHFPDVDFHGSIISSTGISLSSRLEFYDNLSGQPAVAPIPYTNAPWIGRFDETGERFLSGGGDSVAQVWDWQARQIAGPALPHTASVTAGQFFHWNNHSRCVTGDYGGAIHFWDYESGMELRPPIRQSEASLLQLLVTPDGKHLIASQNGITIFDFDTLLPKPSLSPKDALLLSEIDASAEVHSSGGLVPLSAEGWLEKWQAFRQRHPDYPGHQLASP